MFEIDIEHKSQKPCVIFIGQKTHGDKLVLKAQEWIENNPSETDTVDDNCCKLIMGSRTIERRFKKCTGNSIAEYIRRVKVEFAKKNVIYETGYNDTDVFRKIFKKHTYLSLIEYRKKHAV